MRIRPILIFLLISLSLADASFAQGEGGETEESEGRHSLAFVLMHSRIGQGVDVEGSRQFTLVPAYALDYNFWISEKFALGLHTDLMVENYFVESESEGDLIERERPVAPAIMGTYRAGERFSFELGFGGEFAKGEDYFVTRMAVEYGVEIRDGWEMLASISQDFRANVYNVTSVGIGMAKRFGNSRIRTRKERP